MTPAENLAPLAETGAASSVEPAAEAGPFVINLCSSSTPMALPRADLPELQRFNFFVSRRFEEGRERFRLHMGFFATQAEAENWLGLVREVYPGAWAGEAPGKKLRARAVAAAEAQAAQAAGPRSAALPVEPAAPQGSAPQAAEVTLELVAEPAVAPPVAEVARPVPTLHPPAAAPAPAEPGRRGGARESLKGAPPAASADKTGVFKNSNIREVLAALDEPKSAAGAPRPLPRAQAPLSEAQVLQCLEGRIADAQKPAAFAVQLKWSVQPIAIEKLPPLAIFSAYTLYCVEGSREGRKWYGLRLGFFNDPISAKQVAGYVRSEFASAAVVPVGGEERQRVSGETGVTPLRPAPKTQAAIDHEFKLFDADAPAQSAAVTPPAKAPVRELHPAGAAKRAVSGGKVHARERRAPQTLEETLEILGAHELTIDNGHSETADVRGAGQGRKAEKSTPFTRLLERLGERVRKN